MSTEIETPFDLPPIVMKKYSKEDLLDLLRNRIGKSRMPSSSLERMHSKAEYLSNAKTKDDWILEISNQFCTDFYIQTDLLDNIVDNHVWLSIILNPNNQDPNGFNIVIDLHTQEAWVVFRKTSHLWQHDMTLAIDTMRLLENLDTYV